MPRVETKIQQIQKLKSVLARHAPGGRGAPVCALGAADVDLRLTGGGLSRAGLHEVVGASYPDMGAAAGFAAGLAARLMTPVPGTPARELVWVARAAGGEQGPHDMGALYGAGLAALGLDAARLLVVAARTDREALWVTEEAIGTRGLAGVVTELAGQGRDYGLTASRRLQLAAEKAQRPALLLAGHAGEALPPPSAALTRFRVAAAPGGPGIGPPTEQSGDRMPAPGAPRYRVWLDRVRGGRPGEFILEWNHAACRFGVAAPIRGGAVCPPANAGPDTDRSTERVPDAGGLAATG